MTSIAGQRLSKRLSPRHSTTALRIACRRKMFAKLSGRNASQPGMHGLTMDGLGAKSSSPKEGSRQYESAEQRGETL